MAKYLSREISILGETEGRGYNIEIRDLNNYLIHLSPIWKNI